MKPGRRWRGVWVGGVAGAVLVGTVLGSCSQPTPPPPPPSPESRPAASTIYFVPFEEFPTAALKDLVTYCRDQFSLTVQMLPAPKLDASVRDETRAQLVAEELITLLQRGHPELAGQPNAVLIGLTRHDMYARAEPNWRFVFGWRQGGRFAVISSSRLDPYTIGEEADDDLLRARLRKTVARYVGFLHYRLPVSDDRGSVLYRSLLGVDDLDLIGDGFTPVRPSDPAATTTRSYTVREHGAIDLAMPAALRYAVSRPRERPLVVRFVPAIGDHFDAWVTVAGRASADPNYSQRGALRPLVEKMGTQLLPQTVESSLTVHEIRGAQASGYHFSLTARAPTGAEPKHFTLAMARVGDLLVTSLMRHGEPDPTERRLLLGMLTTARHRWDGAAVSPLLSSLRE